MFSTLGVPELLIILVLVLIVFGAGKLPKVMRSMGEGVKEFRDASEEGSEGGGSGGDSGGDSAKAEPKEEAVAEVSEDTSSEKKDG